MSAPPATSVDRISEFGARVGMGCASLGNLYQAISEAQAQATLSAAWDSGIRFFDTAPYYGLGLSERRLGDGLRNRPHGAYTLSSKVGRLLEHDPASGGVRERYGFVTSMPFAVRFDYSYDGLMRSFEESLGRLGLDQIDVLLVHDIGQATHRADHARHFSDLKRSGYRALEQLRTDGLVKKIGLGVNEWEVCVEAMALGKWDVFLLAGRYTLIEQSAAVREFFPRCAAHGAAVILGGIYNSGILATGVRGGASTHYNYASAPPEIVERVARIESICDAYQVSLRASALQFALAQPLVDRVVLGLADPAQVAQAKAAFEEAIPDDFWIALRAAALIDEAAPVPGAGAQR